MTRADATRPAERWSAATGLVSLAFGGIGGALERGWPSGHDPVAVAVFVSAYRNAILGQSFCFLVSAALNIWFFGALRGLLARAEGDTAPVANVAFGAGVAWATVTMVAHALQIGTAMAAGTDAPVALLWTAAAVFGIANLPLAVLLLAVTVVTFRHAALPGWLGAVSLVAAGAEALLFAGTFVDTGPLAPDGWLTYALYPLFAVWLVPTAVVLFRRLGAETPPVVAPAR